MRLTEFFRPDRVVLGVKAADKVQALNAVAKRASSHVPVAASAILAALSAREQLGSTGLGRGFALPHVRIEGLQSMFGMLVRLAKPVDYEAIDKKPVDVLFLLLIPIDNGSQHVAALAAIARNMREPGMLDAVRTAGTASVLYERLIAADK